MTGESFPVTTVVEHDGRLGGTPGVILGVLHVRRGEHVRRLECALFAFAVGRGCVGDALIMGEAGATAPSWTRSITQVAEGGDRGAVAPVAVE